MLLCTDYDVIVSSEPWLHKEINDNELGLFKNHSFFFTVIGEVQLARHRRRWRINCGQKSLTLLSYNILLQNNNVEQSFVKL